jgi:hemerythrin-like domain-containing protein
MIQIQSNIAPPVGEGHLEDLFEESLKAIVNSLRFMDTSGVRHTVDEEESLFPRLRNSLSEEQIQYLGQLESQHREVDAVYDSLKEVVAQLQEEATPARISAYRELVEKLTAAYRAHIASEDSILMEMARSVLTADELAAMQSEMRARR